MSLRVALVALLLAGTTLAPVPMAGSVSLGEPTAAPLEGERSVSLDRPYMPPIAKGQRFAVNFSVVTQVVGFETITLWAPEGLAFEVEPVVANHAGGIVVGADVGTTETGRSYATMYGLSSAAEATRRFALNLTAASALGDATTDRLLLEFQVDVQSTLGAFTFPAGSAVITVDGKAPTITFGTPLQGGEPKAAPHAEVAFSVPVTIGDAHFRNGTLFYRVGTEAEQSIALTAASTAVPFPATLATDHADVLHLRVLAYDRAGNEKIATRDITFVDTTKPLPIASGDISGNWRNSAASITFGATDVGSDVVTIEYTVNDTSPVTGTTLTLPNAGQYTITWLARDSAGNEQAGEPIVVKIDTGLPRVPGFADRPTTWAVGPVELAFNVTAASAIVTKQWSRDGIPLAGDTLTLSEPGETLIQWGATSAAGNAGNGTFLIQLDPVAPVFGAPVFNISPVGEHLFNAPVTLSVGASARSPVTINGAPAPFTQTYGDGEHTVVLNAVNAANLSAPEPLTIRFTVDTEISAPTVSLSGEPGLGNVYRDAVEVSATPATDGDVVKCYLDGSATPLDLTADITAHGRHTLLCGSTDLAGNDASAAEITFFLDALDPVIAIDETVAATANIPRVVFITDDLTVTARARFGEGAAFDLEPVVAPTSDTQTAWRVPDAITLTDGTHTLFVQATDAAGNVGAWTAVRTFHLATSIVPATLNVGPGTLPWRNSSLELTWTLPANPGAKLQIDGVDATSPYVVSEEGIHVLELVTVDDVGNNVSQTLTVRIDASAPDVVAPIAEMIVTNATLDLAFATEDGDGSPSWVRIWLAGVPVSENGELRLDAEGPHHVRYQALDLAGNAGPMRESSILVDLTPPALFLGDQSLPASGGRIAWTALDAIGGPAPGTATLLLANGSTRALVWTPTGADVGALPVGQHALRLTARDAAGNAVTREALIAVGVALPPRANTAPEIANVTISFARGLATANVGAQFDAEGDAIALSYTWTVDGVVAGTAATFAPPLGVDVRVTVTPFDGRNHGAPVSSAVFHRAPTPPRAVVDALGLFVQGAPIVFSASSSTDADGYITSYIWRFDDGSTAEGSMLTRTPAPGIGYAQLTVTDETGLSATAQRYFYVQPPAPPAPTAPATPAVPADEAAPPPASDAPAPPVAQPVFFEATLADGTQLSVALPDVDAQVLRESVVRGDPIVLIGSGAGLHVWRPGIEQLEPATAVGAEPSPSTFDRGARLVGVDIPPANGWRVVTLDDPHPLAPILAISARDGTLAPYWREGARLGFITDVDEVVIRYQIDPMRVVAEVVAEGDAIRVAATTPGSVGTTALAILENGAPATGVTAIDDATWLVARAALERTLEVVATDGAARTQRTTVVVPALPPAVVDEPPAPAAQPAQIQAAQQETPGAGALGLILAVAVGAALSRKRRQG